MKKYKEVYTIEHLNRAVDLGWHLHTTDSYHAECSGPKSRYLLEKDIEMRKEYTDAKLMRVLSVDKKKDQDRMREQDRQVTADRIERERSAARSKGETYIEDVPF